MKRVQKVFAAVLIAACLMAPVSAIEAVEPEPMPAGSGDVSPRAEEVMWCYREVNGRTQRRLWSITYGCWLTEWEYFD